MHESHSARIGGATRMLAAGATSEMVRLAGRWRSDTWRISGSMPDIREEL